MTDQLDGTSELSEQPELTATEAPEAGSSSGPEGDGFNPAWAGIRDRLGDTHFQLIKDELAKMDKAVEGRISSVNGQLSEYKKLGEPAQIQQAMQIAQRIDADPAQMYQLLGDFLQRTGRMPTQQEAEQLAEQASDETEALPEDPRIAQLQQGQEQMVQFLQQQQWEADVARESSVLERELEELRGKGYSNEDLQTIHQFTVQIAEQRRLSGDNRPATYADGAQQFDALRTRILSAPRPGDSAPKLLPTSGGSASQQQARPLGQLSRGETTDLVAQMLSRGSQR